MIACENSGHSVPDDLAEISKIVEAGATTKTKKNYELSPNEEFAIFQNAGYMGLYGGFDS